MQIRPYVVGSWHSQALSDPYLTATNCPFATGGPYLKLATSYVVKMPVGHPATIIDSPLTWPGKPTTKACTTWQNSLCRERVYGPAPDGLYEACRILMRGTRPPSALTTPLPS